MNRREAQNLTQNIPITSDDDDEEENSNMVSHQYKKYTEFEKIDFLNNNNSEDPQSSPTHGNNNIPEKFKMIHLAGADGNDLNPVVIPGNSNNTKSKAVIPDDSATNMGTDSESMVQNSEQSVVPVEGNEESELPSTEQIEVPGPATPERGQWSNPWEFVLSCIALSVGLGNVWRFPFIAYRNGGGAFLIPYFLVVLFIGRPIYFLELCLGQFSSLSSVQVWRINPFFAGVGLGSMIATLLVLSYYITIMALTVFYFCASFQTNLPWDTCNKEWKISNTNETYKCIYDKNTQNDILDPQYKYTRSAPELYYELDVLKQINDIDEGIGAPDWRMTLCLLFCWIAVFFSLVKGVKSAGKVAYFTALFPYVVLLILLCVACTLKGAGTGVEFFFKPNFTKIKEPKVWYEAVTQCFYSLNTGFGSIIMFSSFNPVHQNIYRDAMIISFMDTFTSFLAGITIFAVLGNLAYETNMEVEDVLSGSNGLAFISYPRALASFGGAKQFFSVIFFLMLFTLGIGSVTADAAAIITIFYDAFPKIPRWLYTALLCGCTFLVGIMYMTPGGQFILNLVDFYGGSFIIFITSGVEVVGVAYFYGVDNFMRDVEFMMGVRLGLYWKICWLYIIPFGLVGILFYYFAVDYENLTYNDVEYPVVATFFGWLMVVSALLCLPGCAIYAVYKSKKLTLKEKIRDALTASPDWGPRDPQDRKDWIEFKHQRGRYVYLDS